MEFLVIILFVFWLYNKVTGTEPKKVDTDAYDVLHGGDLGSF
jgi:hypothetical protein